MAEESMKERIKVSGEQLVEKTRELIHEGNVRRIIIKNSDGETVIEVPVTIGVIGAVVAPVLAAVGAVAALASSWTIEIERKGK
jgi:hypothetical protein